MHDERPSANWQVPGALIAVGTVVLFAGLMAGPSPGDDPAEALQRINDFRTRYILTNGVDLIGVLILTAGLLGLVRLLAVSGEAPFAGTLAGAGVLAGGAMLTAVLTFESTVIPGVAARFVDASGAEQATQLAIGEAMLEADAALFGITLMLFMLGVTAAAVAFLLGAGPWLNRWFLLVGALLAGITSLTGMAFLFEPVEDFGRLEPVFSLAALVWLAVLGVLLWRTGRTASN